jgi:hypothetical protein
LLSKAILEANNEPNPFSVFSTALRYTPRRSLTPEYLGGLVILFNKSGTHVLLLESMSRTQHGIGVLFVKAPPAAPVSL